jgi:hypothetical protein
MTDTKYVRMWLVENDKRGAPALQYRSANHRLAFDLAFKGLRMMA